MKARSIPVKTIHLFPKLNRLLIDLLKSLSPEDWNKSTIAPLWTVKDIVAHLLDTNIRSISAADHYEGKAAPHINSYTGLVNNLNELNAVWVKAMERVSPQQLIRMLEATNKLYVNYLVSLDPFSPARYSVAWAGEEQSANWFHIAREYTEKWHHQQQIRDVVNQPGLIINELFYPCMDTFLRGLPYAYRNETSPEGTIVKISISGDAGGEWYLCRSSNKWELKKNSLKKYHNALVVISPDTAWKVFTKGIRPEQAMERSTLEGDSFLAGRLFYLVAVMA